MEKSQKKITLLAFALALIMVATFAATSFSAFALTEEDSSSSSDVALQNPQISISFSSSTETSQEEEIPSFSSSMETSQEEEIPSFSSSMETSQEEETSSLSTQSTPITSAIEITPASLEFEVGVTSISTQIPDEALAAAVASALHKEVDDPITQQDIDNLTYLSAGYQEIEEVSGLDVFTNLRELWLSGNPISQLPDSFSSLLALGVLVLQDTSFTEIPSVLADMNILYLHMGHCNIETIPDFLGDMYLGELFLSNNSISSLQDSFGGLSDNLTQLDLSANKLEEVPSILSSFTTLQRLNLFHNQIASLPEFLFTINSLTHLWLGHNPFSALPASIGNLTNIQTLELSSTNITSLPNSIGQLENLTYLNVSNNQLTALPNSIANLDNLEYFYIGYNNITALPVTIGNLTSLITASFNNNKLTQLPASIVSLPNLKHLILSDNTLTSLPSNMGQLPVLTQLSLDYNQLTALPDSIGDLEFLEYLTLTSNQLSSLPVSLGGLQNLYAIDISMNQFTSIPPSLFPLAGNISLNLGQNYLMDIPPHFYNTVQENSMYGNNYFYDQSYSQSIQQQGKTGQAYSFPALAIYTQAPQFNTPVPLVYQLQQPNGTIIPLTQTDFSIQNNQINITNLSLLAQPGNYLFSATSDDDYEYGPSYQWHYTQTFTLQASIVTFDVSFNSNGGSPVATQSIVKGQLVTKPTNPTKANNLFDGWYKEASLANLWNFAAEPVTAPTTLYAKWKPESSSSSSAPASSSSTAPAPAPSSSSIPASASSRSRPQSSSSVASSSSSSSSSPSQVSSVTSTSASNTFSSTAPASSAPSSPSVPPSGNTQVMQQREETRQQLIDAGVPTLRLGNTNVPLFGGGELFVWSLLSLLLMVASMVISAILGFKMVVASKSSPQKRFSLAKIVPLTLGVVSLFCFFLLYNVNTLMVLVDTKTILFTLLLAGQLLAVFVFARPKTEKPIEQ